MNLSKKQKNKRDAVEEPMSWAMMEMKQMEEVRTRIEAAMKVWPETRRTLEPAFDGMNKLIGNFDDLQDALSILWNAGFEVKWK